MNATWLVRLPECCTVRSSKMAERGSNSSSGGSNSASAQSIDDDVRSTFPRMYRGMTSM